MEGSGAGIGRLDCYEDMFKEITRKLYGDDPDHRTSSVQNEFETSVSYKNDDETDQGTDGSDDGNWTCEDEALKGTDGSRIAAYHAGKATWRCYECGECMGGGPRDVAEHFFELHSSRIIADDGRRTTNHHHHHHHHQNHGSQGSPRKDYIQNDLKIEEIVTYLERVRDRAERGAPPSRRTQETQTVPAALLPVTTTFLIQELPTVSPTGQQHLNQTATTVPGGATSTGASNGSSGNNNSGKRYTCPNCPYGTDRRDLYTRHENIHREEKPFHCYVCFKPFNRADHVKKHFLRMHREHGYELSRIRRTSTSSTANSAHATGGTMPANSTASSAKPQADATGLASQNGNAYNNNFAGNKSYQLQTSNGATASPVYQVATTGAVTGSLPVQAIVQPDLSCATSNRRMQNGGCNSKSHVKGGAKGAQERRYTCCYCSWSGVDNWCLKRHLNTHLKPFACALCEYKAARAERLATHVYKVHNKRQCSRCSFLGEDAAQLQVHQLHVHRVSSASAPAPSTQQTAAANNRHQQPVHPSGGGRPPPGPPVFPASSPTIVPATSVIPSTTILGKMGLGYDDWFAAAQPPLRTGEHHVTCDSASSGSHRRSRKQSTPRKVLLENCDDNVMEPATTDGAATTTILKSRISQSETKTRDNDKIAKDYFKCYQCPENAPARGHTTKPYHTRASLALHTLWRHRRRARKVPSRGTTTPSTDVASRQSPVSTNQTISRSSITLKATVITTSSANYYQR